MTVQIEYCDWYPCCYWGYLPDATNILDTATDATEAAWLLLQLMLQRESSWVCKSGVGGVWYIHHWGCSTADSTVAGINQVYGWLKPRHLSTTEIWIIALYQFCIWRCCWSCSSRGCWRRSSRSSRLCLPCLTSSSSRCWCLFVQPDTPQPWAF